MLPNVAGEAVDQAADPALLRRLVAATLLPELLRLLPAGSTPLIAAVTGASFIMLAWRLFRTRDDADMRRAGRTLFTLFAELPLRHLPRPHDRSRRPRLRGPVMAETPGTADRRRAQDAAAAARSRWPRARRRRRAVLHPDHRQDGPRRVRPGALMTDAHFRHRQARRRPQPQASASPCLARRRSRCSAPPMLPCRSTSCSARSPASAARPRLPTATPRAPSPAR